LALPKLECQGGIKDYKELLIELALAAKTEEVRSRIIKMARKREGLFKNI